MRNLKRALSLALAAAMLISLMVVGASAASYGDADSIDNTDAVEFLTSLGVVGGDQNGNFQPDATLTRAEFCVMIANALTGGSFDRTLFEGANTPFTDVVGHWGAEYIAYCYSVGVIAGTSATTFNPDGTLTAAQASAILLSALGYNQNNEFGANGQFELNVTRWAQNAGLYDDLSVSATAGITRDQTAQLVYNAMAIATPVVYNSLIGTYSTEGYGALTGVVLRGDTTYGSGTSAVNGFDYTLAATVFSLIRQEGYVVNASYNENTGKYRYVVEADIPTGTNVVTVYTTNNLNDAVGLYVEALYKTESDGTRTAYGLNSLGNEASATWGELSIGNGSAASDQEVTLAGTTYDLTQVEGSTPVYTLSNGSIVANGTLSSTFDPASALTLVDEDRDGDYDYAVVTPATVAQVTYVGTRSITAGAAYTFEDNDIYEGVARDDFALIVAAVNTVERRAQITEVGTVQGVISALRGDEIQIDGVWYDLSANTGDTPAVGNTVALAVVGEYYYNVETIEGRTLDDVIMILDAGNISSGLNSGVEAQVMNAGTGTVSTITISKVDDTDATRVSNAEYVTELGGSDAGKDYTDAGNVIIGAMYTFVERNGRIELTTLANNVIGNTTFMTGTTAFTSSTTNPTVAGANIADDAVVMVYTTDGSGRSAYITGADLKTWNSNFGDTAQVLTQRVNGVATATLVALYDAAAIPGSSGSTGYGYVTANTYYVREDNTSYAVMTIWTEDGALTNVRAESLSNADSNASPSSVPHSAFIAPTASNVAELDAAARGTFVTFEYQSNGNIAEVQAVGTAYALTGYYVDRNGETVLTLDNDGAPGSTTTANITDDTQIIYVDTDNRRGADGGALTLAQQTASSGYYVLNVVAVVSSGDVSAIFVDVNNNLASNAGLPTPVIGSNLTGAEFADGNFYTGTSTSNSSLKTGNFVTNSDQDGYKIQFTGALDVVVLRNGNEVGADANLTNGDVIRVVAQDGTVAEYTVVIGAKPASST